MHRNFEQDPRFVLQNIKRVKSQEELRQCEEAMFFLPLSLEDLPLLKSSFYEKKTNIKWRIQMDFFTNMAHFVWSSEIFS